MRERLNCPNCGAPIRDTECPYCGTLFYDFASIDLEKAAYIRVKRGDELITAKAQCTNCRIDLDSQYVSYYADNEVYRVECEPSMTVDLSFDVLVDNGVLMTLRK